ncbi:MAG: NTP transferase domain-containing protein [Desulfobacterales bacterium]|nr:NTP transferase domain-containing protein [Desulfobacterales bacterium]
MVVVILAGGTGSRLKEKTRQIPKALIRIGNEPILIHIMRHFAYFGLTRFIVATGYRAEAFEEAMASFLRQESWKVTLVDTGPSTHSGGRLRRLAPWVNGDTFMMTWCDGLADLNIRSLLEFHHQHGRLATLTAVHPPSPFGYLDLDRDRVVRFCEKRHVRETWINGAFFVLEPEVLDYIENDDTPWEEGVLERLARKGDLMAFRHQGFWHNMDTVSDHSALAELWQSDRAPWKIWE